MNSDTKMSNSAPQLPTLPVLAPLQSLTSVKNEKPHLLNIPREIRNSIYGTLAPDCNIITLGFEVKSTISELTSLLQVNSTINSELRAHIDTYPLTLKYLGCGMNILHYIPRQVLSKVQIVILAEDSSHGPSFEKLPSLHTIILTQALVSSINFDDDIRGFEEYQDQLGFELKLSRPATATEARAHELPIPPNNDLLKTSHAWWKDLRIRYPWIREVLKAQAEGKTHVSFILRTLMTLELPIKTSQHPDVSQAPDLSRRLTVPVTTRNEDTVEKSVLVMGYEYDVSVDSKKVLKKGYVDDEFRGEKPSVESVEPSAEQRRR